MRWLFHVLRAEDVGWGSDGRYRAASLGREGFIHGSYRDAVLESARLYFPSGTLLKVLEIDPRRLDVPVDVVTTPRGEMPHIRGPIPIDAVRVFDLAAMSGRADRVKGTRIGFCAFEGMTLLDLVGPLDALSRIGTMGFDPTMVCEVIALTKPPEDATVVEVVTWRGASASLVAARYRPPLDHFDVLIVPGGPTTTALVQDAELVSYLDSFPHNRLLASVCTGSLLLAAAGRLKGKRATTHASAMSALGGYGVRVVTNERVVDEGNIVTAGGVTSGIDLGLHLVQRLEGEAVAAEVASRMEVRR